MALICNPIALLATAAFVPGISFRGDLPTLFVAALLLGLFNLIVRPIALLLALPVLILTLGLFYFVLNGLLLWAASHFLPGYHVTGLVPGILGSLVISMVNWALGTLVGARKKDE